MEVPSNDPSQNGDGYLNGAAGRLFFRSFGRRSNKPPVLLLHGLLYFSYDWIDIAKQLGTGTEVVALDQRGFGDSDWSSAEAYKVLDFVEDIERTLQHFGWDRCILVGHSMGGRIALAAAEALQQRVAGTVVLDAPPSNSAHGARRIGDQVAGTPARFRSLEHVLKHFPATPWPNQFDETRRERFKHYTISRPDGLLIKRDVYFHHLFMRVKMRWPYHSYEGNTWPMGQEFDYWKALRAVRTPLTLVSGTGVGDVTSPETIQALDRYLVEHRLGHRHVSTIAHHNIPGRHASLAISEIDRVIEQATGGQK